MRAEPATSWTRTMRAPCVNDHTVVASVASSRSAATGVAGEPAEERSCARHRPRRGTPTAATRSASRASNSRLCATVLPKPMPGIGEQRVGADAGRARGVEPRDQELDDLAGDVVVVRRVLHRAGLTLHVHQHERGVGRRRPRRAGRDRRRPAVTSLTIVAPARSAAAATTALLVSMLTGTAPSAASASTTGSTRRSSSSGATGSAPGRVDSPPTSRRSAPAATSSPAVRDRPVGIEEATTVGEGVGGHVHDTHDRHNRADQPPRTAWARAEVSPRPRRSGPKPISGAGRDF